MIHPLELALILLVSAILFRKHLRKQLKHNYFFFEWCYNQVNIINKTTGGFRNNQLNMSHVNDTFNGDRLNDMVNNRFHTFFSMDEVTDINEISPFTAECIEYSYNTFWSDNIYPGIDKTIISKLPKGELSWLDLWKVIDKQFRKSKDYHHKFIEEISYSKTKPNTLVVFMGS